LTALECTHTLQAAPLLVYIHCFSSQPVITAEIDRDLLLNCSQQYFKHFYLLTWDQKNDDKNSNSKMNQKLPEPLVQSGNNKQPKKAVKVTVQSDFKLDLILKKLVSIETPNSEIVTKVKDIEIRVVSTENELKSVREDCERLTCTVQKLQSDMNDLSQVPSSSSSLQLKDQNARRPESDYLYAEINKLNLLISGIFEPPQESSGNLAGEVQRLIQDITGKTITIDIAHRIGRIQPNHVRSIKVRFLSVLERNCVYFHRKKLCHPYYINEDLSPGTRRDHSLLRRKRNDIWKRDKDANIKIDWRSKTLKHINHLTSSQGTNISFLEESQPSTSQQQRNVIQSLKL
jgi:hypothetical protein